MVNKDPYNESQEGRELSDQLKSHAVEIISSYLNDKDGDGILDINEISKVYRPSLGDMIPVTAYRMTRLLALREVLGNELASSILQLSGRSLAAKMNITSINDIVHFLESMAIGKLSVEAHDNSSTIISARECAVCAGIPNIGSPVCSFEGGFIAGGLEKFTGHRYNMIETDCWALGNNICRWKLTVDNSNTSDNRPQDTIDIILTLVGKTASNVNNAVAIRKKNLQLKEANKKIQESNQMMKDLTSMIVHDMRVPLTAIAGSLEMLDAQIGKSIAPQASKLLDIALSSSRMLINMVSDLQDISKMEEKKLNLSLSPTCVQSMINQAVRSVELSAHKKKIRLQVEIDESLPEIMVDAERMTRVILNLLNNAIKFTPSGGNVAIKAYRDDKHRIYIAVSDTGEGIPTESQSRIFDKFFQLESSGRKRRSSSGLGLAYCKMMTEAHGGSISVDSKPGMGSTFTVVLPSTLINR